MNSLVSMGKCRGENTGGSRFPSSRQVRCARVATGRSVLLPRNCHDPSSAPATGSVVDAVGRFSRMASTAVLMLVLMGNNTSARSSCWREASQHQHQHHHNNRETTPWTAFAPPPLSPHARSYGGGGIGSAATSTTARGSRRPRMASLGAVLESRRARALSKTSGVSVPTAVAGDAKNARELPAAHLFSVQRNTQGSQQRLPFPTPELGRGSVGRGAGDGLQSPRFAVPGEGRSYPERLSVSVGRAGEGASAAAVEGSRKEDVFVTAGGTGRPALPELSAEELTQLQAGQRVQKQTREGGAGSGSVVVDVRADPDVVLEYLTKYNDFATMIDTVRECEVFPSDFDAQRKVEVTVSRFRLRIRVLMTLDRERQIVQFELDPDCTKAGRAVLREATGFFFVESPPDRPGYSRVWMLAKVDVNRFVPGAIVDYAASRALPRASNWIKPTCEAAQRRKLREGMTGKGVATAAAP